MHTKHIETAFTICQPDNEPMRSETCRRRQKLKKIEFNLKSLRIFGLCCIDYTLITNLMHWLLFIYKILYSSTCFEPPVLIFRRIQLYTCSIWYCHSSWWSVSTQFTLFTDRPPRTVTVPYAACIQLYLPEDEHLRLETCRGE